MRRNKSVKMQAYVQSSYHIKIFLNSNKGKKSLEGSQVSICGVSEIEYGPNSVQPTIFTFSQDGGKERLEI